jgi:HTH-type transcriptional regulator/antitoxin HigA
MIATAYRELLQEYVPRPIRSERAYERMLRTVDDLMMRPRLSRAEDDLLEVHVMLVERYESIRYATPSNPPDRMLAHLIESKGVSRAEVSVATGISRAEISAVLAARRGISDENASKLSRFFGVSPSVFAPPVAPQPRRKAN